jgi:hypothetical protein
MRRTIGALLLTLTLACATYAGDIPFDYTGKTPSGTNSQSTATGDIPFDLTVVINLLQLVLP